LLWPSTSSSTRLLPTAQETHSVNHLQKVSPSPWPLAVHKSAISYPVTFSGKSSLAPCTTISVAFSLTNYRFSIVGSVPNASQSPPMAVFRSFFDPATPCFLSIFSLHKKKKTLLCLWDRSDLVVFVSILGYGLYPTQYVTTHPK
jgi:hypothetical protein